MSLSRRTQLCGLVLVKAFVSAPDQSAFRFSKPTLRMAQMVGEGLSCSPMEVPAIAPTLVVSKGDPDRRASRPIEACKAAIRNGCFTSTPDIVSRPRHSPLSALSGPSIVRGDRVLTLGMSPAPS